MQVLVKVPGTGRQTVPDLNITLDSIGIKPWGYPVNNREFKKRKVKASTVARLYVNGYGFALLFSLIHNSYNGASGKNGT